MPDAVRAVVAHVAQGIDADDRALLVGKLERSKTLSTEERMRMLESLFPMLSSSDLRQTADMWLDLPVQEIHNLLCRLPTDDVARAKEILCPGG
jgi:hypothetical protein